MLILKIQGQSKGGGKSTTSISAEESFISTPICI